MSKDLDFKAAEKVTDTALRHVARGTPILDAWPDVVKAARPAIGPTLAALALRLPIVESLTTVTAEFAALLGRDRPGPAIKGLWIGLVELAADDDRTEWVPYIAGSRRFNPDNPDWPVNPAWFPDDCYAPNPAHRALSDARRAHEKRSWSIETMLIEPLHYLMVSRIARDVSPHILLGPARQRGIGAGFDDGDHHTLGVIHPQGLQARAAALTLRRRPTPRRPSSRSPSPRP